jgi:ABC-2 type transport system permease protein
MSITAVAPPAAARGSALWRLSFTELKLFLRERTGPIFGIGFPMLLLIVFGNLSYFNKPKAILGGLTILDTYVPILITFVIGMLALNVLPPVLAGYREKGILRRLQTTPVGPARVLAAQLLISLAFTVISGALLLTVARLAFNVVLPRQLGGFVVAALLAAAATISVGLFIAAAAATGRAANAIGATLFYVAMFFAGLFLPIPVMPKVLQHISHGTPLGAAVEALTYATKGHWPHLLTLGTMAAYVVVFGLGAATLFRWE